MTDTEYKSIIDRQAWEIEKLKADRAEALQETETLKTSISKFLALDVADFERAADREYSADLLEAYRATIKRTFKTLRRLGIEI